MEFICIGSTCDPPIHIARLAVLAFLAVLFLQSAFDKVLNWKGELGWITEHFAKTPFKNFVPQLLGVITLFELSSGLACALGFVMLALTGEEDIAQFAMTLCAMTFVQLFAGQRLAKDYPGAASIAPYFLIAVVGLVLLSV